MERHEILADFLKKHYETELALASREEKPSLTVDFSRLDRFNPPIADALLENPLEVLEDFRKAVRSMVHGESMPVRVRNLPDRRNIRIRNLRSDHIGKLMATEAIVKSASEVKPQIDAMIFHCPDCESDTPVKQEDFYLVKKLTSCGNCGRRGEFPVKEKRMTDIRVLKVVEPFEITTGEQPSEIAIILRDDLTTPKMQKKTDPGNRIKVTGILKDVPKHIKGKLTTHLDTQLEANHIESSETEFEELDITSEDEAMIRALSRDPHIYEILRRSIAPGIHGIETIKDAIVLQLFGGIRHRFPDGNMVRGNIHILLTGDPGVGKTQLLKMASRIVPRGRYVSGSGVTGAGLCTKGDTLIQVNDGSIVEIGKFVEEKLYRGSENPKSGIWTADGDGSHVLALDKDFKIVPKKITKYWKLRSPEKLIEITTRLGRKIIVTADNPMPAFENGNITWKSAKDLNEDDFLAVPRVFPGANCDIGTFDSIDHSARLVNNVNIINIIIEAAKSRGTIRDLAKKCEISENSLYHGWRGDKAPKISDLENLCNELGINLEKILPDEMILEQWLGHKIKIPKLLDENIMYIFGLIAGDGSLSKTQHGGTDIKFCSADEELLRKYEELCKKSLGIKPKYYKHPKRIGYLRFNSKLIGILARYIGIPNENKALRIEVGKKLSGLPNNLVASYLRGLFDTDGYVSIGKTKGSIIGWDSISEKFARGIQMLLLRFDVISSIRRRHPKTSVISGKKVFSKERWSLEIQGIDNITKFNAGIGFNFSKKSSALQRLIEQAGKGNTNIDVIPHIGKILRSAREKSGMTAKELYGYKAYSYEKGMRKPSRTWLADKASILLNKKHSEEAETLSKLSHSDIFFDQVKSMKFVQGEDHVYDITVEDEHSFVANGMIIHNTASVRKDEVLGTWVLEAGALILCNRGLISIDEFDKMSKDDQIAMHEATSVETVSIAKASIVATLPAQTSVLAGANPKLGRFDPMRSIRDQIEIPETLLSRFDLKFMIRDEPKRKEDRDIVDHITMSRTNPETVTPEIDTNFLRKYIAYSKKIENLDFEKEAMDRLKDFYVEIRSSSGEGRVGITLRQFEALVRLAEASAKIRLDTSLHMEDAERAISIMKFSLSQLGYEEGAGYDIDKFETGISSTQRGMMSRILDIISELEVEQRQDPKSPVPGGAAPEDEVKIRARDRHGFEDVKIEEVLERLKMQGMIYSPKPGFIKKLS